MSINANPGWPAIVAATLNRLAPLDIFKGATIVLMIVSSYHGNLAFAPPSLVQSFTCGWHIADLVVPFFLWAVGMSVPMSIAARRERGSDDAKLLKHILTRSAALYAIGLALDNMPCIGTADFGACVAEPKLFGIFQRIAVAYAAGASIVLLVGWRIQVGVLAGTMLIYQLAILPELIVPPCDEAFRRDFSTSMPAACYVLAGALTSRLACIAAKGTGQRRLFAVSALMLAGAYVLEPTMPLLYQRLNLPFFLLSCGLAGLALWVVSAMPGTQPPTHVWKPFAAAGMNPLTVYVISATLYTAGHKIGFHSAEDGWASAWETAWRLLTTATGSSVAGSLLVSLLLVAVAMGVAWLMALWGLVIRV